MYSTMRYWALFVTTLLFAGLGGPVQAQHEHGHSDRQEAKQSNASSTVRSTVLQAPGESVFGAVQEAIRRLEADSTTDWSQVDVARLHQHLLDMHRVAVHVAVEEKTPIENGVRLRVRPTTEAARASLDRVLDAHPHMLKQEAGWSMTVEEADGAYVLRTTTDDPADTAKIRALGYMGLLAYGQHHQRHHWHLVNGKHPHHRESK
jgi:hypothetical protein